MILNDVMDEIEKCHWLTDWLTQWPWPAISRVAFTTKKQSINYYTDCWYRLYLGNLASIYVLQVLSY